MRKRRSVLRLLLFAAISGIVSYIAWALGITVYHFLLDPEPSLGGAVGEAILMVITIVIGIPTGIAFLSRFE